jgi:hypothetical protein
MSRQRGTAAETSSDPEGTGRFGARLIDRTDRNILAGIPFQVKTLVVPMERTRMSDKDLTYEPEILPRNSQLVRSGGNVGGGDVIAMEKREPVSLRALTYEKSGSKPLLVKQAKILRAAPNAKTEVDILTTGEVYMSHVYVRRRLNDAVGPMGWALRPISEVDTKSAEKTMFREFALIVLGRVVATAFGSAKYYTSNARMDFADTAEAVKSNALTRCAKDLGIGSECWDRRWCDEWREQYAVHVWALVKKNVKDDNTGKWAEKTVSDPQWRRIDAKPLKGEVDIVRDSPNADKWRKQTDAWSAMLEAEAAKSKATAERLQKARRALVDAKKLEADAGKGLPDAQKAAAGAEPPQGEPAAAGGESRADVPQGRTEPPGEAKTAPQARQASAPVSHATNGIAPNDRQFLIRNCKIVDKTPKYTLHVITMMDGGEYVTFSTRQYDELQKHFAARDRIQIFSVEEKIEGKTAHRKIVEWKVLASGEKKK